MNAAGKPVLYRQRRFILRNFHDVQRTTVTLDSLCKLCSAKLAAILHLFALDIVANRGSPTESVQYCETGVTSPLRSQRVLSEIACFRQLLFVRAGHKKGESVTRAFLSRSHPWERNQPSYRS